MWRIFFLLAVVFALTAEGFQHLFKRTPEKHFAYAQEQLRNLEKEIHESLNLIKSFSADSQYHEYFIHSDQQHHGFTFFYFQNGMLRHWSDNEVTLPENLSGKKINDGTVLNLSDGIYEAFETDTDGKKIVGLILIRKNYAYENKFLISHFNPVLDLDQQFEPAAKKADFDLKSASGKLLTGISYSHVVPDVLPFKAQAWFYLFAFIFFFSAFYFFFEKKSVTFLNTIAAGALLLLIRLIMIAFRLPGELYYNDFFSPKAYGSSFFFNSPGDLLLNAFAILIFSAICFRIRKGNSAEGRNKILIVPVVGILLFLFYALHLLLSDLILNSKISFETNIGELNIYSLTATLSMMMLLWSFWFIAARLLHPFLENVSTKVSLPQGLIVLIVLSLYAGYIIHHNVSEKKNENQKLFAQRLDARQDELAEYLFDEVQQKISADTVICQMLTAGSGSPGISQYVQQQYLKGYFSKFDAVIYAYDSSGNSPDTTSALSYDAAQAQFASGKITMSPKLALLPDESAKLQYFAFVPVRGNSSHNCGTITILLNLRSVQLAEGFPELLLSNNFSAAHDETGYSYARYSNGMLVYAGGNYPYAFHENVFGNDTEEFQVVRAGGYKHVAYHPSPQTGIVVSRPAESFFDAVSLFSYVLLFFLIVFLLVQGFFYLATYKRAFHLSLKQRIRSALISLVVISFALIAAGTVFYIVRKYDADKNKNILARLNTLWFAITDKPFAQDNLSEASAINSTNDLRGIAADFNLDFNIYDESGKLFYSSQPKLFEQGILSTYIQPEAFFEMQLYGQTQFVHAESIGKLNYVAAYAPLTDRTGNITGYLNLPYFEKQNELNKEISGFLSALINIYLFLLVVSLLLALVITSRITKPLLLIQEKLSSIRIGSRNEAIEWKRNDEIGQLVRQYNKMVEALAESAALLARSERESAWREMAMQVAHEIKNPLTPMKLSVQHLQRAWNERSGNLDELFKRISKTLIEQIDALSTIASEFSNFANMPRAKNEALDLHDVLRSSVNLFDATPGVEITLDKNSDPQKIFADREQLVRAFSNLIKNAVQSIPESRHGRISISSKTENGFHVVAIADNGSGIPDALRTKIFTPNFTTKSSGTGLGLAMVKSTVEAAGGIVDFKSEEGKGSTFYISLPVEHKSADAHKKN